jgi:hypothetical protein
MSERILLPGDVDYSVPEKDFPHYHMVPKDVHANMLYRRELREMTRDSKRNQAMLKRMCSEDLLFYVNAFVWTFDPRKTREGQHPLLPFVTYPFQDLALHKINQGIMTGRDVLIEKSRDMGATWCCLLVYNWRWHFRDLQSFMLVSRKEDLVDKPDDPDCLMWKLDFIRDHEPAWLRPRGFDDRKDRSHLKLINRERNSTILGDSTTGDVTRGGRKTSIFLDEFASVDNGYDVLKATRDASDSRVFNSTPKGQANAFYDLRKKARIEKLAFLWTLHPEKSEGLYTSGADGQVELLDNTPPIPGYEYILDGKVRSPWYDLQCERAAHPQEIAQEIDMDYQGSDFQFFDMTKLDQVERACMRPPEMIGELDYSLDSLKPHGFKAREDGRFKLWITPDIHEKIPHDRSFVMGIDIALGTGASDSAIEVFDRETGEQVCDFANNNVTPEELGPIAVALAWWFNEAYMIWEANGAGQVFGKRVTNLGYRNIFYKRDERSLGGGNVTMNPGFYHTLETKLSNFVEFRRVLGSELVLRSKECYDECRQYIHTNTGKIVHSASTNTVDPTGKSENHGDRMIACVLAWRGILEIPFRKEVEEPVENPHSLGGRRARRREANKYRNFY